MQQSSQLFRTRAGDGPVNALIRQDWHKMILRNLTMANNRRIYIITCSSSSTQYKNMTLLMNTGKQLCWPPRGKSCFYSYFTHSVLVKQLRLRSPDQRWMLSVRKIPRRYSSSWRSLLSGHMAKCTGYVPTEAPKINSKMSFAPIFNLKKMGTSWHNYSTLLLAQFD